MKTRTSISSDKSAIRLTTPGAAFRLSCRAAWPKVSGEIPTLICGVCFVPIRRFRLVAALSNEQARTLLIESLEAPDTEVPEPEAEEAPVPRRGRRPQPKDEKLLAEKRARCAALARQSVPPPRLQRPLGNGQA